LAHGGGEIVLKPRRGDLPEGMKELIARQSCARAWRFLVRREVHADRGRNGGPDFTLELGRIEDIRQCGGGGGRGEETAILQRFHADRPRVTAPATLAPVLLHEHTFRAAASQPCINRGLARHEQRGGKVVLPGPATDD
jgi:hypothetical protein